MFDFPTFLSGTIADVVAAILMIFIALVAEQFRRWTGLQIEEKHQRALHTALMSGADAAINGGERDPKSIAKAAEKHARRSVPDAFAKLKPDVGVLDNLAGAAARQAVSKLLNKL